jgi:hypothetical protein
MAETVPAGCSWRGKMLNHDETYCDKNLPVEFLSVAPPNSIPATSVADWMVATAIANVRNSDSVVRTLLGQSHFLGQDAFAPDGKTTVNFAPGLTMPWEMKTMVKDLLGFTRVERMLCYWRDSDPIFNKLVVLRNTASPWECFLLISDTRWHQDDENQMWAAPEHWVRVLAFEPNQNDSISCKLTIFSYAKEKRKC